MAERYPGDGAAANGFGRRHLHEWEAHLLHEANYLAPPDMRAPGRWRLSAGGIPIPTLPDVEHLGYFHAEIERVRASLSEEEWALLEYDAGNHKAWAAYFEHRQAEWLASINNAPVVRGRNNSDGRHMWWGAPRCTLNVILEYLEGGNDQPLEYPAAPAPRRSGSPWLPRRMLGGSSSSSRSPSHSSGSPALVSVKGGAPAATKSSTREAAPPRLLRPASSSRRRSRGSPP